MRFSLTNAQATLQAHIDDCLPPSIDDFTVCYLEDILIHWTNEKEHEEHVRQVLRRLKEFSLHCKSEKCQFGVSEVRFLGFVFTPNGVGMESDRISTIGDWLTAKIFTDVQVLLGFTNIYRRFIGKYTKVTLPLQEILNKADKAGEPPERRPRHQKSENCENVKWEWMRQDKLAFRKLNRTFTEALILEDFDPANPKNLQTDTSGFAIAGILNQ
jgi:hypothetical protein